MTGLGRTADRGQRHGDVNPLTATGVTPWPPYGPDKDGDRKRGCTTFITKGYSLCVKYPESRERRDYACT